jgi:hypothetical protein
MSEDKSVRMLLQKAARPAAQLPSPTTQQEEDYTAFAHGRISQHPQLMVVFRRADGSVTALSYASLLGVESSNPAIGFMLEFGQQRVRIVGKQLDQLLRLICQHRVAEIREASRSETFASAEDAPLVETIDVQKGKP